MKNVLYCLNIRQQANMNRGMQIRGSVLFFGQICGSDVIFVQIQIRITLKLSVVKSVDCTRI